MDHAPQELTGTRLEQGYQRAREALLAERTLDGLWVGELSTSALSTATAVMALEMFRRGKAGSATPPGGAAAAENPETIAALIDRGIRWIAAHQNADGGWGDTLKSVSNISTTMLCHAVFHATQSVDSHAAIVSQAHDYIERAGGVPALRARYGKDKTFSIPILTHCALAGLVPWQDVSPLPFELACIPASFYKTVRLPVVSYALPALIAIGQARHHFRPSRNPLLRWVRNASVARSLQILERIQPTSGGFLEATPLTSFVVMSLAAIGRCDHPVTLRGIRFIRESVREDGSWPIDTNLATWVTTLSINALAPDIPAETIGSASGWLLGQQYRVVHPYTNADPGGWAWTDLTGGVPDADDTPGAILALLNLHPPAGQTLPRDIEDSLELGVRWLLDLQNGDGGWPTFCKGWGTLPFDRSAPDLTAHAIRALNAWKWRLKTPHTDAGLVSRSERAVRSGIRYLQRVQRGDGSWLPLWFGNQFAPDDENPVYGTAKVLAAWRDLKMMDAESPRQACVWLAGVQNQDGGWGGGPDKGSSIEETALAVEALYDSDTPPCLAAAKRGTAWLLDRVERGKFPEASPIGFYFAKLWYFEKLYPLIFTVAALGRAIRHRNRLT